MDVFKTLILDTPDSLENISGVLPVVNGGTGADNAPDARVNLLPNYTGNANKVLSLNGTATDVEWTSNGAGDVAGPASSTDNAVARFDSTTGKLIQNSGVSISDANLLTTTALTVNDNTTLGSSNTDTVNFNARVASDINPSADDTYDLGVTGHEWRNLNIDGTANIDSLVADTADVNGGTIDGATIGATTPSTGAFTTLGATGVLTITKATGAQTVANTSGNTTGTYQSFGTSTGTKGYIGLGDQLVSGGSVNDVGIDGFAGNVIFTTASVTRATVTSTGLNSTAIGATTPSTGAFTTLSASSAITNTLAGGSLSFNSVSGNTAGTYNQFTTSAGAKIYYGIGSQIIGGATVNDFVLDSISGNVIISTAETARATFSSTGLAVTGAISVNNTAITTSSTVSSFLTPNLVNANRSALFVGRSFASNDAAYIGYTPESTSSLSQLNLGLFGADNLVNITAAGNVGIGTTTPSYRLDVQSTVDTKLLITGSTNQNGMRFGAAGTANEYYLAAGNNLVNGGDQGFLIFNTTSSQPQLFIEQATRNVKVFAGFEAVGAIAIGNTVNTVSPTSPDRTITMVIGGTTYYIHAKTTND